MAVKAKQETVYFSQRKGRRFLTLNAAIQAEAEKMIEEKYETEIAEPEVGYFGWYWREDGRLVKLHSRLCRFLKRQFRSPSSDRE